MTDQESKLEERIPVWRAFSEFFVATKLDEADCDRIALTLADSHYSERELEEILRYEVLPVCQWNWISMVGEWPWFSDEFLLPRLKPLIDRRPWYFRFLRVEKEPWNSVKARIAPLREVIKRPNPEGCVARSRNTTLVERARE